MSGSEGNAPNAPSSLVGPIAHPPILLPDLRQCLLDVVAGGWVAQCANDRRKGYEMGKEGFGRRRAWVEWGKEEALGSALGSPQNGGSEKWWEDNRQWVDD